MESYVCTSSDRQLENIFPLSSDRHMATQDPPSHLNFGAFRYCATPTLFLVETLQSTRRLLYCKLHSNLLVDYKNSTKNCRKAQHVAVLIAYV